MAQDMPEVTAEFGTTPTVTFPESEPPAGLKVVELVEGNGPVVRAGDTVTVNYHGVVWGSEKPFDSSFARHTPSQLRYWRWSSNSGLGSHSSWTQCWISFADFDSA